MWPGPARLLQVPMYGMSVREVLGRAAMTPFIDRVIHSGPAGVTAPDNPLTVPGTTWKPCSRGASPSRPCAAYTAAFLQGYRHSSSLRAEDAAAVPLFQRLRIASRACYVTAPDTLARIQSWMRRAFHG